MAGKTTSPTKATGPQAVNDTLTTAEDTAKTVSPTTLLANDTGPKPDELTITAVSDAPHGSVGLWNGVITYTPDPNYFGADSFEYLLADKKGDTSIGTVNVTVTSVPDPVSRTETADVVGIAYNYSPNGDAPDGAWYSNTLDVGYTSYGQEEYQGVAEFRIADVPATLTQATLSLQVVSMYYSLPFEVEVFAYNGDGIIGTDDWSAPGGDPVVGRASINATAGGFNQVSLDTSLLNGIIAETGDWLGIGLRYVGGETEPTAMASFHAYSNLAMDLVWVI